MAARGRFSERGGVEAGSSDDNEGAEDRGPGSDWGLPGATAALDSTVAVAAGLTKPSHIHSWGNELQPGHLGVIPLDLLVLLRGAKYNRKDSFREQTVRENNGGGEIADLRQGRKGGVSFYHPPPPFSSLAWTMRENRRVGPSEVGHTGQLIANSARTHWLHMRCDGEG